MAEPDDFVAGRAEIVGFPTRKWQREQDHALRKNPWTFGGNRIAVRFSYEWHDEDGRWWRGHGNANWEFDDLGYMSRREAGIDDVATDVADRRIVGPRPDEERYQELPLR